MDEKKQDDQLEPMYNSSVPIQDVAWKTSRERWTIETSGKRGSGRSVLEARHDDDDEIYNLNFCNNYQIEESCYNHRQLQSKGLKIEIKKIIKTSLSPQSCFESKFLVCDVFPTFPVWLFFSFANLFLALINFVSFDFDKLLWKPK